LFSFLILFISGLFHILILSPNGIFQLFFILAPLLPFLVNENKFKLNERLVSLLYLLGFIPALFHSNGSFNFSLEGLFNSEVSSLETNQHPFVFGLFVLLFLFKKDYLFFIVFLFLTLISFKRIVVLALVISIPFLLLERKYPFMFRRVSSIFVFINLFLLFLITLFVSGYFNEFIIEITGISVGQFTMGRNSIYDPLIYKLFNSSYFNIIFGYGQGSTYDFSISEISNSPHNDLLVLFLDRGLFIFV
jgi:hypothetical protein